MEMYVVI